VYLYVQILGWECTHGGQATATLDLQNIHSLGIIRKSLGIMLEAGLQGIRGDARRSYSTWDGTSNDGCNGRSNGTNGAAFHGYGRSDGLNGRPHAPYGWWPWPHAAWHDARGSTRTLLETFGFFVCCKAIRRGSCVLFSWRLSLLRDLQACLDSRSGFDSLAVEYQL
jgi:hypothetical protein